MNPTVDERPTGTGPACVITGIGLVAPAGRGVDEVFHAVCAGRSGLRRPPVGHPAAGLTEVVALAPPVDPLSVLAAREARYVDNFIVMALVAAADALADAGIEVGRDVDPERVAVVVASGAGGLYTFSEQALAHAQRGGLAVTPYLYPGFLPNMASAWIALKHDIRGFSSAISTACAASAHALAEASRLIHDDEADVVVCGGSEAPLSATGVAGFANARALAHGWDDPARASRPFDRQRNGFVLGEGAGILVVERAAFAAARGASGYADLIGWGASTDAHHATMPHPDGRGAAASMRRALRRAGISAGDVGYINAHGTGTKLGDIAETRAIHTVFGQHGPAVSATKPVTGHLLGGIGAVEGALTALAVSRGLLPPTLNLDDPDPECDLDHVVDKPRQTGPVLAMSNSFAFGGHNVSLLFAPASIRGRC